MKKTARFPAFAAPFVLAALLTACMLPPYDEGLSLAQATRTKMRLENAIGPVSAWLNDDNRPTDFRFLPARNDPANGGGYLANFASYGMELWYLGDAYVSLGYSWSTGVDNDSSTTNNFLLQPIKSSDGYHYLSLVLYPADALFLVNAMDPYSISSSGSSPISSALSGYGITNPILAVGSGIYPGVGTSDAQYVLVKGGDGLYTEMECAISGPSGLSAVGPLDVPNFALGFLPATLQNAFYGHDPVAGRSYLSYWSSSAREYKSYSWNAYNPSGDYRALSGIEGRIDAVLSNGQLLSFQDGACTVYSGSGAKLHRFPMGDLRFCYERWDGLEYRLYFSLAYWIFGRDETPDELHVQVYSIPTVDLADLD